MQEKKLKRLPTGSIKPQGWLRDQFMMQIRGLTGRAEELLWQLGETCEWKGGKGGDAWEQGPYYLDGLTAMAYVMQDDELIAKAQLFFEYLFNDQDQDGWFGPEHKRDDYWPRTVVCKAMVTYYEATRDPRALDFLRRFYHAVLLRMDRQPMTDWAQARGGDLAYSILWLYEQTGEKWLLDVMEKVLGQTLDWSGLYHNFPWTRGMKFYYGWEQGNQLKDVLGVPLEKSMHYMYNHVVNVAMSFKEPALRWLMTGDAYHREAVDMALDAIRRYHGQPAHVFSGDEHLSGTNPSQGTELCSVVEYLFSLQNLMEVFGRAADADQAEFVAYNALPAALTRDYLFHQYDQQANQVLVSVAPRCFYNNGENANVFGVRTHFGCCTTNFHHGWPKFLANTFMKEGDDVIVGLVYAPCRLDCRIGEGDRTGVTINEETEYPFRGNIRLRVDVTQPEHFKLKLRIPGWCRNFAIHINGRPVDIAPKAGFIIIDRQWSDQTVVELDIDRQVRQVFGHNHAVTIEYGALVFALHMQESWQQRVCEMNPPANEYFEVSSESSWNYALEIDPKNPQAGFEVSERAYGLQPYAHDRQPIKIKANAVKLPYWGIDSFSAAEPPLSPIKSFGEAVQIELIPYAAATMRITAFPWKQKDSLDEQQRMKGIGAE